MITARLDSQKGMGIRRFRLDAVLVCLIGLAGSVLLLYLILDNHISAALFLIPFLFCMAFLFFGFHELKTHASEYVHINWQEKRIAIYQNGRPVCQLPLQAIDMLYITGGLFKTMLIKHKKEHYALFTSFFFGKQFFNMADKLGKAGVPLGAVLKQQIALRAKNAWRIFILILLLITMSILAYTLLSRPG